MLMSDALAASQLGRRCRTFSRTRADRERQHQPTRRRERQMEQFKSAGQAQRFLSTHDQINNLFRLRSYGLSAVRAPPLPLL